METVADPCTESNALAGQLQAYIAFAQSTLVGVQGQGAPLDLDPRKCDPSHANVEICILFPNLTNQERDQLLTLRLAQVGLALAINCPREGFTEADLARLERILREMESGFMQLKAQWNSSNILSRLSPLQRQMVESFLTVPFSSWTAINFGTQGNFSILLRTYIRTAH
jgi:hypothetical protein